jgi:hypothetical protein
LGIELLRWSGTFIFLSVSWLNRYGMPKPRSFTQDEGACACKPSIGYADMSRERMDVAQMALER